MKTNTFYFVFLCLLYFQSSGIGSVPVLNSNPDSTKEDVYASMDFIHKNFISLLQNVPSDFEPGSLQDFINYLPRGFDFTVIQAKYDIINGYMSGFLSTNTETELWEEFGLEPMPPHDPVEIKNFPECFSEWYYSNLKTIIDTALCRFSAPDSAIDNCDAKGVVSDQAKLVEFNECMDQYKD